MATTQGPIGTLGGGQLTNDLLSAPNRPMRIDIHVGVPAVFLAV